MTHRRKRGAVPHTKRGGVLHHHVEGPNLLHRAEETLTFPAWSYAINERCWLPLLGRFSAWVPLEKKSLPLSAAMVPAPPSPCFLIFCPHLSQKPAAFLRHAARLLYKQRFPLY